MTGINEDHETRINEARSILRLCINALCDVEEGPNTHAVGHVAIALEAAFGQVEFVADAISEIVEAQP